MFFMCAHLQIAGTIESCVSLAVLHFRYVVYLVSMWTTLKPITDGEQEDCNLRQSQIGLHSACNNMRITGSNIDMMDLAGIVIDGGAATDIVGNLIEGNSGP